MARYTLIDDYLDTMRSRIRWRRDLDDLVAEMEDHLYSTTEGMCARGIERSDAQRATLERFGDPKVLQLAYASNHQGGIAMPTQSTIRAGNLALVAAAAWIGAVLLIGISTWFDPDGWLPLYFAISGFVTIGGVLGLVAMIGLGSRVGGFGPVGMIGLVVVGVGVLAGFAVTWALPLWMSIQGIGMLLVGFAAMRYPDVPRLGILALASGFVIGGISFAVANVLELGWRDYWGDYPVAWFVGALGSTVVALGLAIIGRWLAGEEPVGIDSTPVAA
jgi:hypothetical protein